MYNHPPADVFISYPHSRMRWVEDQLYAPLQARRPDLRIFLERQSMPVGVGWLSYLAEMVHRCCVFLPVYCTEYFQSDYCQWELLLALARDPIGRKRIIVPVRLGLVALPPYCTLIQAEDATQPDFFDRLVRVLAEVLLPEPR